MGWVTQEDEGGQEALAYHLVGYAQKQAQLAKGMGRVVVQAVVEEDDLAQMGGESIDEAVQTVVNFVTL